MANDMVQIALTKLMDEGRRPFYVDKDAAVLVVGERCEDFACDDLLDLKATHDAHGLRYRVYGLRDGVNHDRVEEALNTQEEILGEDTTAKWNYLYASPGDDDPAVSYEAAPLNPLPAYRVTPFSVPQAVDAKTWGSAPQPLGTLETDGADHEETIHVAILDLGRQKDRGGKLLGGELGDTNLSEATVWDAAAASPQAGHAVFVAGLIRRAAEKASLKLTFKATVKARRRTRNDDVMRALAELFYAGPDNTDPPDIVNLSFGTYTSNHKPPTQLQRLLNQLRFHFPQTVFVAAAGNSGRDDREPFFPAACEGVVAVAATDEHGLPMPWSNSGDYVMVCTDGDQVLSDYFNEEVTFRLGRGSTVSQTFHGGAAWSGTSFAAPTVTGLIAATMTTQGLKAPQALEEVLKKRPEVLTIKGGDVRRYGRWVEVPKIAP